MIPKWIDPRDVEFWKELQRLKKESIERTRSPLSTANRAAKPKVSQDTSQQSTDLSGISSQNTRSTTKRIIGGVSLGALAITGLVLLGSFLQKSLKSKEDRDND